MSEEKIQLLERRLKRESNARKQAENLLETKSLELYKANNELQEIADSQEDQIKVRTEELKVARDKALSASEAKSNFLATMSHEIRTPMNGVIGMANLLLDTELNAKQRRQLSVLLSSSESLLQIINDVLDLSKLESGKLQIQEHSFDLYELIDDILNSLSITSFQKNLELINTIDSKIPRKLIGDPLRLRQILINLVGNAIKFTESGYILLNVVSIDAENKKDSDEINLKIEITDTGKGISKDNIKKLFKPFSQVTNHKYNVELQEGTGLGLSICKKLSSIMQGNIGVTSKEKEGTTFWVTIPFKQVTPSKKIEVSSNSICFYQKSHQVRTLMHQQLINLSSNINIAKNLNQAIDYSIQNKEDTDLIFIDSVSLKKQEYVQLIDFLNTQRFNSEQWVFIQSVNETNAKLSTLCETHNIKTIIKPISQLKLAEVILPDQFENINYLTDKIVQNTFENKKLLLAEDNKVNQMVTKALLQKRGIEVTIANDGIEALEIYKENHFDLIFMDINMPRMGGLEALENLRKMMKGFEKLIPVIALTANALEGAEEEYLSAGMDGYLAKPIEMDKLEVVLNKWL